MEVILKEKQYLRNLQIFILVQNQPVEVLVEYILCVDVLGIKSAVMNKKEKVSLPWHFLVGEIDNKQTN